MAITLTYPEGCVLVAGGTGRVGEGVVRRMCDAGVPTIFTWRGSEDQASALEAELRAAGHAVWARRMDMRDTASIDATIAFAEREGGRLHSVMIPAGAVVPFNRIADFTPEEVEAFVRGDSLSFYRMINRAVPVLRGHGGGTIIPCSTIALRRVIDYDGISPLSKGLVDALVRQLAVEEARHNIRANAVVIGWVVKETMDEVVASLPPDPGNDPKDTTEMLYHLLNRMVDHARLPRPATPQEAGDLFAFLASDQARYLTGQFVTVDGGWAL